MFTIIISVYPSTRKKNHTNQSIRYQENRDISSTACTMIAYRFHDDLIYAIPFGRKVHDEILSSIPATMGSYKITKTSKQKAHKGNQHRFFLYEFKIHYIKQQNNRKFQQSMYITCQKSLISMNSNMNIISNSPLFLL